MQSSRLKGTNSDSTARDTAEMAVKDTTEEAPAVEDTAEEAIMGSSPQDVHLFPR